MSDYPTDIKQAIEWLAQAEAAVQAADRAVKRRRSELELEYARADDLKYWRTHVELRSYLAVPELIEYLDAAVVEEKRRRDWFLYLVTLANGRARYEPAE